MTVHLIIGDCRDELSKLGDRSVHCVVTSPPFYGLRDYGTGEWVGGDATCDHVVGQMRRGLGLAASSVSTRGGAIKIAETPDIMARGRCPKCGAERADRQIGLEASPAEYVETIIGVMREVWRVLRDDGTAWLNIGDSYANDHKWGGQTGGKHAKALHGADRRRERRRTGIKPKELMLIPERLVIALSDAGWYIRSKIVWSKPNAMPESCVDRPTSAYEELFLLTKRPNYFYDAEAIKVDRVGDEDANGFRGGSYVKAGGKDNGTLGKRQARGNRKVRGVPPYHAQYASSDRASLDQIGRGGRRNARNVWTIATVPFKGAHFATFPPKLAEPCVKAGTSERGCCPDCGAGWRRVISKETAWASNAAKAGNLEIGGKGHPSDQVREGHDVRQGPVTDSRTLGFYPGCACYGTPQLEQYPKRPKRSAHVTEFYAEAITAWQAECKLVDERRASQCAAAARLETVPAIVLDPFGGAGTVALVASRLHRDSVLIELNPESGDLTRERLAREAGLFAKVVP
jgi:DNA modification methylase